MPRKFFHQRRGVVLLLGLLLMAATVASTIAIATAVDSSTHQSKNLDDFVLASLAADSGLERGLSVIKNGRTSGVTIVNSTTASSTSSAAMSVANGSGSTMTVASSPTSAAISIPQLRPFESVTFDFFGYSASGYLINWVSNGSSTIQVSGNDSTCTTTGPQFPCNGQLEVDWIGLGSGGEPGFSGRYTYSPALLQGGFNNLDLYSSSLTHLPENDTAPVTDFTQTRGVRVTVRALDVLPHAPLTDQQALDRATIHNINIVPPAPVNNVANCVGVTCPTGVITLTSSGAAGTSQSIKTASILWQLPASPLFNFVLFTEGDIIPN